jgi:hypothetical protein
MREHDWRSEGRGAGVTESLLSRIDAVSELIDDERYWEARSALFGRRWAQDLDLSGVPAGALAKAQQWLDGACDALSGHDVDPGVASNYLLQARRALTG